MSKIILQPAGSKGAKKHFLNTIEKPVNLSQIKVFLTPSEVGDLSDIYPSGRCYVWGVTPGGSNEKKWDRISVGDVTLFSGGGRIYASGVTTYKIHNKDVAIFLWGRDKDNQTWEYLYFLDEVENRSIPYILFNRSLGYKENNIIQGFDVLPNEKSLKLFKVLGLESETFVEEISRDEFDRVLDKLDNLNVTEDEIIASRRLEQGYLKRLLFGRKTVENCGICHRDFPIAMLVTSHIKKRSDCTYIEKRDANVVMPMCKFGCDELFEKGYIGVRNGKVISLGRTPTTSHLNVIISLVTGNDCLYYNEKTRIYFEWHLTHHGNRGPGLES